ncbi:M14 family metallopeptidase [Flagellimonas sp.]|uniref:M14 family metallopeptidase n=1 Tax=Flagellimonas sp. TaxID=2058762 RepID=UPI003F4A63AF
MHTLYKERSVQGRYVTLSHLKESWLQTIPHIHVNLLGKSAEGREIFTINLGTGKHKILMWSQMHGNESTTTKAVMDLVNFLNSDDALAKRILRACQLQIIPMLNPDGAEAYTRVNANAVDLNRDAIECSQPETRILWDCFKSFQPDFCFNLHDQRTLFNVGNSDMVATVSFLSPASDTERSLTPSRIQAMKLIVGMNKELQKEIPGQIGRYDDAFNANCIGDSFQMEGVPTVLFEAGHYPEDYEREMTRRYIYDALVQALELISSNALDDLKDSNYLKIPENEKRFYDILIRNADVVNPNVEAGHSVGIRFIETLSENTIQFVPKIEDVGELQSFFGHLELNLNNAGDFHTLSSYQDILELIVKL